jgi:hypothetical protein
MTIDSIFVPQGAEHQAVCRGLARSMAKPEVMAIPMGVKPVSRYLQQQNFQGKRVLLLGLGGSLSPQHQVGDVVVYESCLYIASNSPLVTKNCDPQLTHWLRQKLTAKMVKGLTSDRLIYSPREKRELGLRYDVTVVDMESYAILNHFAAAAIVRVISDNCHDHLPDLNWAITAEGKLDGMKMAIAFLGQPLAASKLIRGSLTGLKILEELTINLFSSKMIRNSK